MKSNSYENIGWLGMVFLLIAYFLVSFGLVFENHFYYIALNFIGSIGLAIISYKKKIKSLYVFYIIWAVISFL